MPKPRSTKSAPEDDFCQTLDRFGELDTRYAQAKPWLDEREKLKVIIRSHCEVLPPEQVVRLEAEHYFIDLGPKETKRTVIDPGKVFNALKKAMGLERLVGALSFTMKLIDAWIPKADQAKYVKEERTGARDVTAVVKSVPTAS